MKSCLHFHRHRWGPVVVCSLFGFHCLCAYEPENNIWMERRAARGLMNNPSSAVRDGPHQRYSSLIDKIPRAEALQHTLSPHIPTEQIPPLVGPYKDLLISLSEKYGSVRKITLPRPSTRSKSTGLDPPRNSATRSGISDDRGPSRLGPTIILIQDVHQNFEAQTNIRSAVSDLIRSGRVNVVALEGATEEYHLQKFADYDHPEVVRAVADHLLNENFITGPIHALLTTPGRLPRVIGIDDLAHYNAHVQSVRDSSPLTASAIQALQETHKKLDLEKSSVYSPELGILDRVVEDYHGGKTTLGVYVETLAQKSKDVFPAVQMFRLALRMEQSLDFKQVEKEKSSLIEKLVSTMTPREIESLAANGIAYRSGSLRFGEFFSGLAQLCRQKGISLGAYPAMDSYIRYVLLADGIDPEKLLHELTLLEKNAFSALAKTARQKDLVARTRRWALSRRLVDFSFTPPEWEEWQTLEKDKDLDLTTFESFYREARFRDEAMAKNIVTSIREGEVGILVAGGFHAEGITRILQKQGATVISFVPKITRVDTVNGSGYLSVFCQEKTPLEKLFKGERLLLSVNPLKPETLRIALPILLILSTLALGFLVDVPSTFSALGGMGTIQNIQTVPEAAQAVVAVGLASMAFYAEKRNGALHFSQTPRKPKMTAEFKIKFLDPIREQAIYFFPIAIAIPALAATLINATLGGGLAVFVVVYALSGTIGVAGTLTEFLITKHPGYSSQNINALRKYAFGYGLVSLFGFLFAVLLMAPTGMDFLSDPELLFEWSPLSNLKSIGIGTLFGNLMGIGVHVIHNIKTFPHYLAWRTGGAANALLPLSSTAATVKLQGKPKYASFQVNLGNETRESILKTVNSFYRNLKSLRYYNQRFVAISKFKDFLRNFNPHFIAEYEDLTDVDRLASDDFLLRHVINISVFSPLNASSNDFPSEGKPYLDIDPESWAGLRYLGEEIWWVNAKEEVDSSISQGIGILSPVRQNKNAGVFLEFLKQLKITPAQFRRPELSINNYERSVIENLLKGLVRARIMFSDRQIGYSPGSIQMFNAISKARLAEGEDPTTFSASESVVSPKAGPRFLYAGAMLASMVSVFNDLIKGGHHEAAFAFILYRMRLVYQSDENTKTSASLIKKMLFGMNYRNADWITSKKDPRDRNTHILSILKNVYRHYFYSLDSPLQPRAAIPEVLGPSGIQVSEQETMSKEDEALPELPPVDVVKLVNEYESDGSFVHLINRLNGIGLELPLELIEKAIRELDSLSSQADLTMDSVAEIINSAVKLRGAISRDVPSISELIQNLRSQLKKMILDQNTNAEGSILRYSRELGLNEPEKRVVHEYISKRKTGLPLAAEFNRDQIEIILNFRDSFENNYIFQMRDEEKIGETPFPPDSNEFGFSEFVIALPSSVEKLVFHSKDSLQNMNYLLGAINQIIKEIKSAENNGDVYILRSSRSELVNHRIKKDSGAKYVFTQILDDNRTLVVLWVGATGEAHTGFGANKDLDRKIIDMVNGKTDEVIYRTYRLTEIGLDALEGGKTYGNLRSEAKQRTNSFMYLLTGNPWWGFIGAGVESVFLLLVTQWVDVFTMSFIVLSLFSLAHVWIFARQNPNQPVQQLAKTFFWHYILAVPYALVGVSGFQDMLGGESLTRVLAAAWHLLSDSYLMYQDDRQAKQAARDTLRLLSPPTPSLQVEAILGLRAPWQGLVMPSMNRRGFEKAYLKELGRLSSLAPKGTYPKNPNALMGLLESRLYGIPISGEAQRVHLNIVNENDLPDAIRSVQILKEWKSRGIQTPRLILGAANKVVLERLRREAQAGVVDVLSQPVVDGEGTLRSRILLETLQKIPLPAAYRLTVNLSQTILPDRSDIENLPKGDLAKILREKLLALLRGDPVGPKEFRIQLEIAERLLENA